MSMVQRNNLLRKLPNAMVSNTLYTTIAILYLFMPFINTMTKREQCLHDVISYFKHYDRQLSTRHSQKLNLVKQSSDYASYKTQLEHMVISNGELISGLGTRSWLSEMFQGTKKDFEMLKNKRSFVQVKNIFELFRVSNPEHYNVYLMEMTGPMEFYWVIEQLPYQRGFRVLQSAHDAYTMNAWLSETQNSMLWWNRDLIYWKNNYARMNNMLMNNYGCSMADLSCLPKHFEWLTPWLKYIKNYNKNDIERNFIKAWKNYGAYQIIPAATFYDKYLTTLKNLTDGINSLVGTNQVWRNDLNNYWIELFGTPNQYVFPGAPFIAMTKRSSSGEHITLQAYKIKDVNTVDISTNIEMLQKSLNSTERKRFCSTSANHVTSYSVLLLAIVTSMMIT